MNPDPTPPEPGDDLLTDGADPVLVDAIAMEAVSAVAAMRPEDDPSSTPADARPIDFHADDHRLDIPARLRLFIAAVEALADAHRRGMIHGDIRPANIVVADDGVPRLVGAGAGEPSPEYTSPEQVLGGPPTTASDILAMGVVLYRLLTGRGPYRVVSDSVDELYQAICEQAPERPSRAVVARRHPGATIPDEPDLAAIAAARGTTPALLSRALAGDLDEIVLTAMRAEPERRYAAADLLADDLRRHLDGRIVRAREDSSSYRLGHFMRRHAVAIALATILVLAAAAGVAWAVRNLARERRDREAALATARESRRAADPPFARVIDDRRLDQPETRPVRDDLLRDARGFYEGWAADESAEPVERAAAQARLGRLSARVGKDVEAEDRLRRAVAMWEDVLRSHPDERGVEQLLARSLDDLAKVLARREGRRDEAADVANRAVAMLGPIVAESDAAAAHRAFGAALLDLARIERDRGRPRAAIEPLRRALAVESRLAVSDPGATDPRIALADAHGLLGRILIAQPDELPTALEESRRAVEEREAVASGRPELADQSSQLAIDLGDLADAQQMAGKLDSALASARRAIDVLEALDRRHPGAFDDRLALGVALNRLGDVHRRRGELAESLAADEKARALLDRLAAERPDDIPSRVELARSHTGIGRAKQQSGEPAEALRSFGRAVDLLEGLPRLDARGSYDLAADLSLSIPMVGARPGTQGADEDEALSQPDQLRRRLYADRAIEVLRRAARDGSLDVEILQSDPDFAPIRRRDDFHEIVEDLRKRAKGRE